MKLSPTITVEVDPDYFKFTNGNNQIQLETSLNFIMENNLYTPMQIGGNKDIPGSICINLFDPNIKENPELNRFNALQLFIEYGIGKMFEKKLLPQLRPLIIFQKDEKLSKIFCGYQKGLLQSVAILAGARDVQFER